MRKWYYISASIDPRYYPTHILARGYNTIEAALDAVRRFNGTSYKRGQVVYGCGYWVDVAKRHDIAYLRKTIGQHCHFDWLPDYTPDK